MALCCDVYKVMVRLFCIINSINILLIYYLIYKYISRELSPLITNYICQLYTFIYYSLRWLINNVM